MSTATPTRRQHQFPLVRSFMSPSPHVIDAGELVAVARRRMNELDIHHLPVLDSRKVVGLLSLRDALLAESLLGIDPERVTVREVMVKDYFAATPDAPLAEVVAEMARRKIGSALIVEEGRCVGMFTCNDALVALGELLSEPA